MKMRCRVCGHPVEPDTWCDYCGTYCENQELPAVPETGTQKKSKGIWIAVGIGSAVFLCAIIGIVLFFLLSGDPEEDFPLVQYAVEEKNVDYFIDHVRFTSGESISAGAAEEFLNYLGENQDAKDDFLDEISMGDFVNAENIGSPFSKEYVFGIEPRYVLATTNKDDTQFYYQGEQIGVLDSKDDEVELGPFLKIDIEIKAKNKKWEQPVVKVAAFSEDDNSEIELMFKGENKIYNLLKKNQEYYQTYDYPIGLFSTKSLDPDSVIGTVFVNDKILVQKIVSPSVVKAEVIGTGQEGYVKSTNFKEQSVQQPLYYITKIKGYLNMRQGPSTGTPSLCRIPPDRRVDLIRYANDEFAYGIFDRFEGYISIKYVKPAYSDTAVTYTGGYDGSYMVYDSDSYPYDPSYFETGFSLWELCVARNEIYARYGYTFNESDPIGKRLQEHFQTKTWYTPDYSCHSGNMPPLTEIEKNNVNAILKVEKEKHSQYA